MSQVIVMAGPNGAGKSTMAPALLRDAFAVQEFVNADPIASRLSAFAPESVALTAGRVMLDRVKSLAARRADVAFETTLARRSFLPWLRGLQRQGYILHIVYLWLPSADLAVARVDERVSAVGTPFPSRSYVVATVAAFRISSISIGHWPTHG